MNLHKVLENKISMVLLAVVIALPISLFSSSVGEAKEEIRPLKKEESYPIVIQNIYFIEDKSQ